MSSLSSSATSVLRKVSVNGRALVIACSSALPLPDDTRWIIPVSFPSQDASCSICDRLTVYHSPSYFCGFYTIVNRAVAKSLLPPVPARSGELRGPTHTPRGDYRPLDPCLTR